MVLQEQQLVFHARHRQPLLRPSGTSGFAALLPKKSLDEDVFAYIRVLANAIGSCIGV